jgi:ATP-dependent Zn protease
MTRQPASPPPDKTGGTPPQRPQPSGWRHLLTFIAIGLFLWLLLILPVTSGPAPVSLTYTEFVHQVKAHEVSTLTVNSNGTATGKVRDGKNYTTVIPVELNDPSLVAELE